MTLEKCIKCGKKVIISAMSNSEVRRATFGMDLCLCPDNNSPADIKIIINATAELRAQHRKLLRIGDKAMVFDNKLWQENGGDSKTDSFMREATILSIDNVDKTDDPVAEVRFHHDGRISKGHFVRGIVKLS